MKKIVVPRHCRGFVFKDIVVVACGVAVGFLPLIGQGAMPVNFAILRPASLPEVVLGTVLMLVVILAQQTVGNRENPGGVIRKFARGSIVYWEFAGDRTSWFKGVRRLWRIMRSCQQVQLHCFEFALSRNSYVAAIAGNGLPGIDSNQTVTPRDGPCLPPSMERQFGTITARSFDGRCHSGHQGELGHKYRAGLHPEITPDHPGRRALNQLMKDFPYRGFGQGSTPFETMTRKQKNETMTLIYPTFVS
jgi:hypothetical protein